MPDDLLAHIKNVSKNWTGEAWTKERTLEEFQLYGHAKRAGILDEMDNAMPNADSSNLRKFVELTSLRDDMDKVHHALRKAGR